MRIQPWMTAVMGTLLLLSAQTPTSGQMPSPDGASEFYTQGPPGGGYYAPPPTAPGGSADANALFPGGTPNSFQPWPAISPYYSPNVSYTQHVNRDGLWFKDSVYRKRKFFFSVEGMAIYFRDAGSDLIGSPYARPFNSAALYPFPEFQNPNDGPFVESPNVDPSPIGYYVGDTRVVPFPALAETIYNDSALVDLYPIYNAGRLGRTPTTGGLQFRMGTMEEDYTGMMATGWWGFESTSNYSRGFEFINGVPVTPVITAGLEGQNLTTLNGNIPLNNGETLIPFFGPGATAKYDVLYSMEFSTEAGGANLSFYQQPIHRSSSTMIRPLWGLRYLYLREGFGFRGIDSGFNYSVDEVTHRPDPDTVVQLYDQYEATLRNDVTSHIAGPEIGLRFDLGDTDAGFKVWGETILGLNVNNERIHLYGDNIGDPLTDVRFNGFAIPRILDDANFNSAFDSKKTTTHVSPLFQQSIFADMDIMSVLPLIRDCSCFDDSTFRIGYTFLWVGSVARPVDTIKWQGFPLFPEIDSDRTSFWAHQFSASLDFHF